MTTPRQEQFIQPLIPILGAIAQINPASLVKKEKLGTDLCFESALPLFIDVTSAADQLQKMDFGRVPHGILNGYVNSFQQIRSILDQISNFSPTNHGNPIQGRDSLINALEDNWGSIYQSVFIVLASRDAGGIRKELEVLTSQISTAVQLSSDSVTALNEKKSEIEETLADFLKEKSEQFERSGAEKLSQVTSALDEVRKAAAEAGVSQTSTHFFEEAKEHLKMSERWLLAVTILAISLLLFSVYGTKLMALADIAEPLPDAKDILFVKYFAQKGLVVFCLTFALVWSVKNYGASRHNYVVNKHRSNALGSFQAFATSAADAQTKSAVLIQATQSIFSPQPSGYVKSDGDNSPGGPVIEILRSVGGSKEK